MAPEKNNVVRGSAVIWLRDLGFSVLAGLVSAAFHFWIAKRDVQYSVIAGILLTAFVLLTSRLRIRRLEAIRKDIFGHQPASAFWRGAGDLVRLSSRDLGMIPAIAGAIAPISLYIILRAKFVEVQEFALAGMLLMTVGYSIWNWKRYASAFIQLGFGTQRLKRMLAVMTTYGFLAGTAVSATLFAQSQNYGMPRNATICLLAVLSG
jgi:hypothetical protein